MLQDCRKQVVFHAEISAVIRNEQGSKFWDRYYGEGPWKSGTLKWGRTSLATPSGPLSSSEDHSPPYLWSNLTCWRHWFSTCLSWATATPQFSRTKRDVSPQPIWVRIAELVNTFLAGNKDTWKVFLEQRVVKYEVPWEKKIWPGMVPCHLWNTQSFDQK